MIWVFILFFALALLRAISAIIGEKKRRVRAIKRWKEFEKKSISNNIKK